MVYDHKYKRFLAVTKSAVYSLDGDTDTWKYVTSKSFDLARYAAAWDKTNERLVVYNVTTFGSKTLNYWKPTSKFSGSWTSVTPANSPNATRDFTMTGCGDYVYVFGGSNGYVKTNQLCYLSLNSWSCNGSGSGPAARDLHSMSCADDTGTGSIMISGGSSQTDIILNDIWIFSQNTWFRNINLPTNRKDHTISFNVNGSSAILFGGEDAAENKLGDIYLFTLYGLDDGDFELLDTYVGGAVKPFARSQSKLVYDPTRNEHILYSGSQNETWKLSHGFNEVQGHLISAPFSAAVPNISLPDIKLAGFDINVDAGATCLSNGMEMLSVESEEEREFIATLPNFSAHNYYWLGVTDKAVAGEWRWASGEQIADKVGSIVPHTFNNWKTGQPNSSTTGQYGVIAGNAYSFYTDFKWNDAPSSQTFYYICDIQD